jgi:prefoldin subunit 5
MSFYDRSRPHTDVDDILSDLYHTLRNLDSAIARLEKRASKLDGTPVREMDGASLKELKETRETLAKLREKMQLERRARSEVAKLKVSSTNIGKLFERLSMELSALGPAIEEANAVLADPKTEFCTDNAVKWADALIGEEGGNKKTLEALGKLEKYVARQKFMTVLKELEAVVSDSNLAASLVEKGDMGIETAQSLRKECEALEKAVNGLMKEVSLMKQQLDAIKQHPRYWDLHKYLKTLTTKLRTIETRIGWVREAIKGGRIAIGLEEVVRVTGLRDAQVRTEQVEKIRGAGGGRSGMPCGAFAIM